ncbi:DEKNAAC102823 [Brettanomyces naardenensis]|uniref:DEKNAAC102823 n=1 Tax=Brettanomyces naardenensis TaxID=13370 RepID=A0A448YLR7_BRENA|nr:DEKNAAC102823 [Brettanomyces naardenensis]
MSETPAHNEPTAAHDEGGLFDNRSSASSVDAEKASAGFGDASATGSSTNLLANYTEEEVMNMGRAFAKENNLDQDLFGKAAAIARDPAGYNSMSILSQEDKESLYIEAEHPWRLPMKLYWLVCAASMAACLQGMDESVINGANVFYPAMFGIGGDTDREKWLVGLVNCAPYLCCSCVSCWMTDWLNNRFSRRGTIFLCATFGALCSIWSALTNTWWHLFIARFFLGFSIGPNSTTVPVYNSESAPARIRGALVMNWQCWTAFGIMLGYVFSLAFYRIPAHGVGDGLNWRLMLGSAILPSLVLMAQIPFCPESPRWLLGKGRPADAFNSLRQLRNTDLQAARDCFYANILIMEEGSTRAPFFQKVKEMISVRRNRNGAFGAWIVMFMQQFCGINVIAYYSSSIFLDSGFSLRDSLIASWGFGMLNWVFAAPAFFMIDRFGRRTLLLFGFPVMAVFLLMAGFAFWIPETNRDARVAVICLGIYIFTIAYSSSEGPVPFTYSAECAALYVRDVTMSFATATCWFFNFLLSLTWPSLLKAFKPQGAFGWYAAWNFVGFFLVLWFLPETQNLTLEELDDVFDVPTHKHAVYQTKALINGFQRKVLGRSIEKLPPLYETHRMAVTNASWEEKKQTVTHVE